MASDSVQIVAEVLRGPQGCWLWAGAEVMEAVEGEKERSTSSRGGLLFKFILSFFI